MSKKKKKAKEESWRSGKRLPTTEELYKNKVEKIVIKPTWYDVRKDVFDFFYELFSGYLWECKFGTAFIAQHSESKDVEDVVRHIESLRQRNADKGLKGRWAPNQDEEEALLFYEIARIIPMMWD